MPTQREFQQFVWGNITGILIVMIAFTTVCWFLGVKWAPVINGVIQGCK